MYKKEKINKQIERDIAKHLARTSKLDPGVVAREYLSEERVKEQIDLLIKYSGELNGKKVLEIGSGYGMFTAYTNNYFDCETIGLEPSTDEYSTAFEISKALLAIYNLDQKMIVNGLGEKMPFLDNSFDIVYSSNVLEHVKNPQKVIEESIRVLKSGGYMQCVVPNYGSFWEGHYCIFWIPYLSHFLAKIYLRLFGKNPAYLDTLQFVNFFSLKKILKPYLKTKKIEVITWGEDIFKERIENINFSSWAGLSKVKKWLDFAKKIKVLKVLSFFMILTKSYTPIILTIKKK